MARRRAALQGAFRACLQKARTHRRQAFVEVFSGSGTLARRFRQLGFACLEIDTKHGPEYDVLNRGFRKILRGWILSGCILGVSIATPCSSMSQALHGPPGSSWQRLRSDQHPLGLPGLNERGAQKVKAGNELMRFTVWLIRLCLAARIPVIVENPYRSFLWQCPEVCSLLAHRFCKAVLFDFCQFNAPWRKRTKIAIWSSYIPPCSDVLCRGRGGICSQTSKRHIVLSGTDPKSKIMWTKLAEPYPKPFAAKLASLLIDACRWLHLSRLLKLVDSQHGRN